jgi:hypothetical protein
MSRVLKKKCIKKAEESNKTLQLLDIEAIKE